MKNKYKIEFIHESKAPKINYILTVCIPSLLYAIIIIYTIYTYYTCSVISNTTIELILTSTSLLILPTAIVLLNLIIRQLKIKPAFIFNDHEITKIHYPPLIYDTFLSIDVTDKKIRSIKEDKSNYNMYISYKFTTSTITSGYSTFIPAKYYAYTTANQQYLYQPTKFYIEVYKNNEAIYQENLEYFENVYFSNPYNQTINMSKFIQTAINDALNKLTD